MVDYRDTTGIPNNKQTSSSGFQALLNEMEKETVKRQKLEKKVAEKGLPPEFPDMAAEAVVEETQRRQKIPNQINVPVVGTIDIPQSKVKNALNEAVEESKQDNGDSTGSTSNNGSGGGAVIKAGGFWIEPSVPVVGKTYTIFVEMVNVGDAVGTGSTKILVDGDEMATVKAKLSPGVTETAEAKLTTPNKDSFKISVSGIGGSQTINTKREGRSSQSKDPVVPTSMRINPSNPDPGEKFNVIVTMENMSDSPSDGSVPVIVNGDKVGVARTLSTEPGEREKSRLSGIKAPESKKMVIGLGDSGISKSIGVSTPSGSKIAKKKVVEGRLSIENVEVLPSTPERGEEANAIVEVANKTGDPSKDNFELELDGSLVGERKMAIPAGEKQEFNIPFTTPDKPSFKISVNGSKEIAIKTKEQEELPSASDGQNKNQSKTPEEIQLPELSEDQIVSSSIASGIDNKKAIAALAIGTGIGLALLGGN